MLPSDKRRSAKQSDFAQQAATIFRWLVWGVIFAMLGVMLYRAVPESEEAASVAVPAPLPEDQRPKLPVDFQKLEVVEDNTQSRSQESEAWFHIFDVLRTTPAETLQKASLGGVSWIQLFNQPDVYRGEPLTFAGRVRGASRLNTPENELGIEKYYRLWLQPSDNRDRLIVVYCLKLPKDFPLGMELNEPVVLTGIFFKRWLYRGKVDFELAPVVLANSIEWTPHPTGTEGGTPLNVVNVVTIVVVALVLSVAIILFWHFRTRRPKQADLPEEIEISEKLFDVKSLDEEVAEENGEVE